MARPPKNKQPVAVAPAPEVSVQPSSGSNVALPPRQIDVEGFVRVRDSVYSRLISIQNLIQTFSQDYLRQTNLLLGLGEDLSIDNGVDANALGSMDMGMMHMIPNPLAASLLQAGEEPKKERKKRQHDANAPKRPLTPYFLYMQTARPIIAADLGADAAKGAVQDEGQRRWGTMSAREKFGWHQAYQFNLRLYNARVHSYKHGNANAKEMTDDEALAYADLNNIPMPSGKDAAIAGEPGTDQEAIAQQLQGQVVEPEPESEEPEEEEEEQPQEEQPQPESPPAVKTPKSTKKGAAGKRKSAAAAAAAAEAAPTPAPESNKKRKRQSKAADETPAPAPEPAKKSSRAKKTKST